MDDKQLQEIIREQVRRELIDAGVSPTAKGLGALGKPRGLGCEPFDARILRIATVSPRAAWAELTGAIKAPFQANIEANFDTTSDTTAQGDLDAQVLGAETFIGGLVYDIQVPSAFEGNPLKTQYDLYYNKTSGIAAKLLVTGRPRYDVSPNFVPLTNLADGLFSTHWPDGWILTRYNSLHMDFEAASPLPFAPVKVTVTFRGWQYVCPDIDNMPIDTILCKLGDLGYCVEYLRSSRCDY